MKKNIVYFGIAIMSFTFSHGQNIWKKISDKSLSKLPTMERAAMPNEYELYNLDYNMLNAKLALLDNSNKGLNTKVIVSFPNVDGVIENFEVVQNSNMELELASKFPDIKSYAGRSIDNPGTTIYFSNTLFGLHLMAFTPDKGTFFIDTYTKDKNNYIAYRKSAIPNTKDFECLTDNSNALDAIKIPKNLKKTSDGKLRVYRLAMACTIEYADFHIKAANLSSGTLAQKKAAVLAAMNVTMTRVNGIYLTDVSIKMNLVANNDKIIFIDSDTYTNNSGGTMLGENQKVVDAAIGSANYDIGHVVSTGGGGVAILRSPCDAQNKAKGVTGQGRPVGDTFDVDYVVHEMGHQFGGTHSYNNSCGGNRSSITAVEPGSGNTIMGYAGICAPDSAKNSDAIFHAVNIAQISTFIASAGCGVVTNNNNAAPIVDAGKDVTIPKGTAFVLRGAATDANTDAASLTYCWEQTDKEISTQPPLQTATNGPNFKSNFPLKSPNRYMPKLSEIVAGNLKPTWEVIPTVARKLNFALTVRDNAPASGQTGVDNILVNVSGTAGPFTVTSQNTAGITWNAGSKQTITWDVAGTTANEINTKDVKILISTDKGLTFTKVLVESTPNDGSQEITVPNNIPNSSNCRIMVEAIGNLFLAVNTTDFKITGGNLATEDFEFDGFAMYPVPNKGLFTLKLNSLNDIDVNVHDLRGRKVYERAYSNSNNGSFNQEIDLSGVEAGTYIISISDGASKMVKRIVIQ
jgi:hypothetical protein